MPTLSGPIYTIAQYESVTYEDGLPVLMDGALIETLKLRDGERAAIWFQKPDMAEKFVAASKRLNRIVAFPTSEEAVGTLEALAKDGVMLMALDPWPEIDYDEIYDIAKVVRGFGD